MALKVALDTLEGLDEAAQSFYVEKDGAYVLDIEGVDDHPDVANLRNAYQAEKSKRQEQGQKLAEAQSKLEAAEAKPKEDRTKADDAEIVRLREALEKERDDAIAERDTLKNQVYSLSVDSQLDQAIRDAGITQPSFQKAAKVMLKEGVELVDGNPIVSTDMGPVPLAEHVKRWASSEGADFVSPPKGGGAGGKSGGSVSLHRSKMTPSEKAEYQEEHGQAAYLALPK